MTRVARFASLVALAVVLAPVSAAAQTKKKKAEGDPPKVQKIQAVERGTFLEADVGLNFMVNDIDDRSYGLGMILGIFAGYDITPFLSIAVGAQALVSSGSTDLSQPTPQGDLTWLTPMVAAQLAILTTERDFLWARVGAGLAIAVPGKVNDQDFGGIGPAFSATAIYEHFTKLRHFSIGAQAGVQVVTAPGVGIGISVMPTVKYTF